MYCYYKYREKEEYSDVKKAHHESQVGKVHNAGNKNILILISALNKHGGGIYQEILEILMIYQYKNIYILLTDVSSSIELSKEVLAELSKIPKLTLIYAGGILNKLMYLYEKIFAIRPYKIYYYCGHNNCYANALIQNYGAKTFLFFHLIMDFIFVCLIQKLIYISQKHQKIINYSAQNMKAR